MPKAKRNRIGQRGLVEINGGAGSIGVPAATRARTDGGHGGSYVSPGSYSGLTAFSSVLRELANQREKAADRAYAEATYQRRRAESRADAEADRAARRAEGVADAAEMAAAAQGYLKLRSEAADAFAAGTLTSRDAVASYTNQILDAAQSAGNAAASQFLYSKATSFTEDFDKLVLARSEQRRQESLGDSVMDILSPVFDTSLDMDDDTFLKEANYARPAYLEGGGTDLGFDQLLRDQLASFASSRVGTPEGDAAFDRLERLQKNDKLSATTPDNYMQYQTWRRSYLDEADRRGREADLLARSTEKEESEKNTVALTSRIAFMTLEERQTELQRLLADPEGTVALLGDKTSDTLLRLENDVRYKTQAEREEFDRLSHEAAQQHIQRMRNDSGYQATDYLNDNRLNIQDQNRLGVAYMRLTSDEEEEHATFVATVEKQVAMEAPTRLGWSGLGEVRTPEADGSVSVAFPPQLAAYLKQYARQASLDTWSNVDPRDQSAMAERYKIRSERAIRTVEEILAGTALQGYKPIEEQEKPKSISEIVTEKYFTSPLRGDSVLTGFYFNSQAWQETPEGERNLYKGEMKKQMAYNRALGAAEAEQQQRIINAFNSKAMRQRYLLGMPGIPMEEIEDTMREHRHRIEDQYK